MAGTMIVWGRSGFGFFSPIWLWVLVYCSGS